MLKGFKDFLLRGNVVDLAVAVVIGSAFGAVVTSFTDKVIRPLLNAITPPTSEGLGIRLVPGKDSAYIDFSAVITATINFVMVAFVVYFAIVLPLKTIQQRRKRGEEAGPSESKDIEVLKEIRDLLQAQAGGSAATGSSTATESPLADEDDPSEDNSSTAASHREDGSNPSGADASTVTIRRADGDSSDAATGSVTSHRR
jgi:large conductance mechanosensitive channel